MRRIFFLGSLLTLLSAWELCAQAYNDVPLETDRMIVSTACYVKWNIRDLNGDGSVNCIDYACMFKRTWDKRYPQHKDECAIVRNKNGSFHHLFIQVKFGRNNFVLVEPWVTDPERYKMEDNWSKRYNPRYNIYGETNRWLRECGQGYAPW